RVAPPGGPAAAAPEPQQHRPRGRRGPGRGGHAGAAGGARAVGQRPRRRVGAGAGRLAAPGGPEEPVADRARAGSGGRRGAERTCWWPAGGISVVNAPVRVSAPGMLTARTSALTSRRAVHGRVLATRNPPSSRRVNGRLPLRNDERTKVAGVR